MLRRALQTRGERGVGRHRPFRPLRGVQPVHEDDVRMILHQFTRRILEVRHVLRLGRRVAGQGTDLVLNGQHIETDLLLRPRDVPIQRVLLLLRFPAIQAPQDQTHHHEKDHDGDKRHQQVVVRLREPLQPAVGAGRRSSGPGRRGGVCEAWRKHGEIVAQADRFPAAVVCCELLFGSVRSFR